MNPSNRRILFIFPRWPEHTIWFSFRYKFPALGLLTIAAMTPETYDIQFVDENTDPIDFNTDADLVALSVMTPLAHRAYEIADRFRALGKTVVLGGIHVSCQPEEALQHADAVVVGEGEESWLRLLGDREAGALKPIYRSDSPVPSALIPCARRDLLHSKRYITSSTIQLTRGCPYDCEYCTVTAFFGRKFRLRPLDAFVEEFFRLPDRFVFIVDDNILSNRVIARELFERLKGSGKWWGSQVPITVADDDDMLKAMAASGCKSLFIGFESLDPDTLKQMGKHFVDLDRNAERIRRIQDHGIGIQGSFILGYDQDTPATCDQQRDFILGTRLESFLISVLTPFPGTRVTERLEKEGRILTKDWRKYDMNTVVFQPKNFTPDELQERYDQLNLELHSVSSILRRTVKPRKNMLIFIPQNFAFRHAWRTLLGKRYG